MFLGSLLILTVLASAQVWARFGESFNSRDMMRYYSAPKLEIIPNLKASNNIIKAAILRSLISPEELRNPTMDRKDSNMGWNSEPGEEEMFARTYGALQDSMVTNKTKQKIAQTDFESETASGSFLASNSMLEGTK